VPEHVPEHINDALTRDELDVRLRTILPAEYQDSYEAVQPDPMGAAGLKYSADGRVAWDEIWGSFCDLAMAGGPPHKGALLEPGTPAGVAANPDRYPEVVEEICRGVSMVTGLPAVPSTAPGWIRVTCDDRTTAAWLLRAIVMENVAVRASDDAIELPASPGFRLEKEIKNVITVIAKTYHYWDGHMPYPQQRAIARLFSALAAECPLVEPEHSDDRARSVAHARLVADLAQQIQRDTGLVASRHEYVGWLGLECPSVGGAVWMMRALVASNVLSRREGVVLFVPVNASVDPGGERMRRALRRVHGLWRASSTSGTH
jgi:hypothetical protein